MQQPWTVVVVTGNVNFLKWHDDKAFVHLLASVSSCRFNRGRVPVEADLLLLHIIIMYTTWESHTGWGTLFLSRMNCQVKLWYYYYDRSGHWVLLWWDDKRKKSINCSRLVCVVRGRRIESGSVDAYVVRILFFYGNCLIIAYFRIL